jgi:two-component system CheB/CheR fusion protein
MAFVLVQHLDPTHESALTHILSKTTLLPVREVANNLKVKPNHIHVIPPNANLSIVRGVLQLQARGGQLNASRSIDNFFESLAQDQHECAIGIILSGAASDGTLGLEAIKAEGGITFAQDESAAYDSMPRRAIAAGCVDFVLPPAQMVKELARIAKHPFIAEAIRQAPPPASEDLALGERPSDEETPQGNESFKKILLLLRNRTGVDFSFYKNNTIVRRINRRIVLNKLATLDAYAQFLWNNTRELDALYSDVLINVTSFFRNPEAFDVLKRAVFPKLVQEKRDEPVRFWVLGCSTGQEPYSLAMAFTEFCDRIPRAPKLQIFATDLNEALLDKGRAALYPKSMMQDVSPERLRRFFVEQEGGYRIIKPLRDAVVFARQNLLNDPPFSRMDLISCRNLLIYIEAGLQRKVMPTFHYALRPKGFLFLGASESIGPFADLFETVDKKYRIYSRKPGPSPALQVRLQYTSSSAKRDQTPAGLPAMPDGVAHELNAQREADRITRNRYAPPGVLLNASLQVLQFRGDTSPFLKPPAGQASFNVLKMAREGLILPLRAALAEAKKENSVVRVERLRIKQDGETQLASLEIVPLKNLKERCYLISFESASKPEEPGAKLPKKQPEPKRGKTKSRDAGAARISDLQAELDEARDHLQSLQEQSEATHEELQASNEEITSANEELQSLNEELETSKEELESANEELTTVNEEMANRNLELGRLNSDLLNLQTSIHLSILLLGRDLAIRRFSAQAEKQFNLLATDVGRPIGNVRHELDMPDLEDFLAQVINTVREAEREVRDKQGRWFSLRARPYLTMDNKVDGAVMVLVDIDGLKRSEQEIAAARDYAADIIDTVSESLLVLDSRLRIESANDSFYRIFQTTASETVGRSIYDLGNGQWDVPAFRKVIEDVLPKDIAMDNFEIELDLHQRGRRTLMLHARRINDPSWTKQRILLAIEDITDRKQAQMEVERARIAEAVLATARNPLLILDAEFRIHSANDAFYRVFNTSEAEIRGQSVFEWGGAQWKTPQLRSLLEGIIPRNSFFDSFEITFDGESRTPRTFLIYGRKLKSQDDGILVGLQDITEDLYFQADSRQSQARKDAILQSSLDAVITVDQEGKIVEFNPAAEKILARSKAEAAGQPIIPLIFPEQVRHDYFSGGQNYFVTGECSLLGRQVELPAVRPDGSEFAAEVSFVAIPGTQPPLFTLTLRDISERKRTEQAIADQARLLDWSHDAIIVRDVQGLISFWNQGAEKLYGWTRAEAVGQMITSLLRTEYPKPFVELRDDLFRNNSCTAELIQTTRDRRRITVLSRWTLNQPSDGGQPLILRSDTDITERKQVEEKLREAQKLLLDKTGLLEQTVQERTAKLQDAVNELEHFSYTISHDMRTPLRAMQSFAELLLTESTDRLTPRGLDYLRRIMNGARRMDALILDALQYTKILHGEIPLAPIDPASVLNGILSSYPQFQPLKAEIQINVPLPVVVANETGLSQCFSNFLSNAVKFIEPGTIPRVRVHAEERGPFVRFWFEDNGIGIAPEYHERIFGMFQQLDKSYEGTGIGLALVRKVAGRMNGKVGVESELGKGSRFWLELKKA